jgi:putative DNA primase/helicase
MHADGFNAVMGQVPRNRLRQGAGSGMIPTKERARGRWRQILPALGIDARFLTGRKCPCPICGGTDRFRFIDRRPGDGMWLCNQCQPRPRPAIDLAVAYSGRPFRETARVIDDILGDRVVPMVRRAPPPKDTARDIARAKSCWARGASVGAGDVVDRYLHHRGIGMNAYPSCLRTSPQEPYWNDGAVSRHPAMLALITGPTGKPISVHRTYLAADGKGKADLDPPRKAVSPFGCGPTIRLAPAAPIMGVAEGVETALSASKLFNVPVWSVLSDYGIATFEPPPECRHLVIFADHDRHGVSQRAAQSLCARLPFPVEIRMPDQIDTDWNDEILVRG